MHGKIRKPVLVTLSTVVFLALVITLGVTYHNQLDEKARVSQQLSAAQQKLAKIPISELSTKEMNLKSQIDEMDFKTEGVKTALNQPVGVLEVSRTLYQIAAEAHVTISELNSSGLALQGIEKVSLDMLPINMHVKGAVPDLVSFILNITDKFPTGLVKSVDLSIASSGDSSATIALNIHSYEGN